MRRIMPYLQLCRVANVFTALADIFLGFLLTHDSLEPVGKFALLLTVSASLYMAGMVFNDIFDWRIDLQERPRRPIPSGRVSLRAANVLGGLLLVTGVTSAALAGMQSAIVAGLLVVAIFAYDGLLKSTPIGPVAMGACRFLNVMLGASAAFVDNGVSPVFADVWTLPQLRVAAALGIYIAGVTWFARHEAGRSSRWSLGCAMGVINIGLGLLITFVVNFQRAAGEQLQPYVLIILGVIALTIDRRLLEAIWDPAPNKVQLAIKTMLLSLVMLDACVVLCVQPNAYYAIGVTALLIPALGLSRVFAVT